MYMCMAANVINSTRYICTCVALATSVAVFRPLGIVFTFQTSERLQRAANYKTSQTPACFDRYLRNGAVLSEENPYNLKGLS